MKEAIRITLKLKCQRKVNHPRNRSAIQNLGDEMPVAEPVFPRRGNPNLQGGGVNLLLPPTSEGWGKVIFSACSHLQGGTLSQVWMQGYPIPGPDRGITYHPRSGSAGWYPIPGLEKGGTSSQVWIGDTTIQDEDGRYPPPVQDWMGFSPPTPSAKQSRAMAAGSVPLAFTQEDYLIWLKFTLKEA